MSKIGRVNLDLQEQAEELGFESVQVALDNGYKAVMRKDGTAELLYNVDDELVTAHEDYVHRKKVLIDKLEMLANDTPYTIYKDVLRETIEFLKEKEI